MEATSGRQGREALVQRTAGHSQSANSPEDVRENIEKSKTKKENHSDVNWLIHAESSA